MAHDVVYRWLITTLAANSLEDVSQGVEANAWPMGTDFVKQLSELLGDRTICLVRRPSVTVLRNEVEIVAHLLGRQAKTSLAPFRPKGAPVA